MRAQILILKSMDFAVAARSRGVSHSRVMFCHLLPDAPVS
jgi:peptide/nickel transport system permease protein